MRQDPNEDAVIVILLVSAALVAVACWAVAEVGA